MMSLTPMGMPSSGPASPLRHRSAERAACWRAVPSSVATAPMAPPVLSMRARQASTASTGSNAPARNPSSRAAAPKSARSSPGGACPLSEDGSGSSVAPDAAGVGSGSEIQRSPAAGPTVSGNGSLSPRSAASFSPSVAWAAAAAASTPSGIATVPSVTVQSSTTAETYPNRPRRAQRAPARHGPSCSWATAAANRSVPMLVSLQATSGMQGSRNTPLRSPSRMSRDLET